MFRSFINRISLELRFTACADAIDISSSNKYISQQRRRRRHDQDHVLNREKYKYELDTVVEQVSESVSVPSSLDV